MMPHAYTDEIMRLFSANAVQENADPMQQYMRNQFPFLGIRTPLRKELTRQLVGTYGLPEEWRPVVRELWVLPEREYQYVALDLLHRLRKQLMSNDIQLLEELITSKSWWDTVDTLAGTLVGFHFRMYPELIRPHVEKWLGSDSIWLQRTAILFQLKYKEQTDVPLLFHTIRACADSREFFLQKAIGWALREYAKTDPEAVLGFVETEKLAPLSQREALKHLR
jgi:3-methyladenine DNA glycosylase AlkD